jgi:AbrB family looped-hinge helix DNA binding protein
MKESMVPIDRAGRIVLPQHVGKKLAIKAGDRFQVAVKGGAVTLTPVRRSVGLKWKGKALVFSSDSDQEVDEGVVSRILEQSRHESFSRVLAALKSSRRRA